MIDVHAELGLAPDADPDHWRRAYRHWVRANHPDRGGDHDTFVVVTEQYRNAQAGPSLIEVTSMSAWARRTRRIRRRWNRWRHPRVT